MKLLIRFLLGTVVMLTVVYLLVDLGSIWRVSNPGLDKILGGFNVVNLASKFGSDIGFDFGPIPPK